MDLYIGKVVRVKKTGELVAITGAEVEIERDLYEDWKKKIIERHTMWFYVNNDKSRKYLEEEFEEIKGGKSMLVSIGEERAIRLLIDGSKKLYFKNEVGSYVRAVDYNWSFKGFSANGRSFKKSEFYEEEEE